MTTVTETSRYGTAEAMAWGRMHQRLAHRAAWEDHEGELPVIEGTLIRLQVDHLPGQRDAEPVWLWSSRAGATRRGGEPGLAGVPAPLRYRAHVPVPASSSSAGPGRSSATRPPPTAGPGSSSPPTPSSTSPATSPPTSGCPGSSRAPPGRLTPSRVRRGYRRIRQDLPVPASAPKPSRPGPGRPAGLEEPAARHPPRRRQNRQARGTQEEDPQADRLNNKLRVALIGRGTCAAGTTTLCAVSPLPVARSSQRTQPSTEQIKQILLDSNKLPRRGRRSRCPENLAAGLRAAGWRAYCRSVARFRAGLRVPGVRGLGGWARAARDAGRSVGCEPVN